MVGPLCPPPWRRQACLQRFGQRLHSAIPESKTLAHAVKLQKNEPQVAQASRAIASLRIPDQQLTNTLEDCHIHGNYFRVDRDHELGLGDRLNSLIGLIVAWPVPLLNSRHLLFIPTSA